MAPINQNVKSGLHIMVKEVCEIFLSCKITQDWYFSFPFAFDFNVENKSVFVNVCLRPSCELGFVQRGALLPSGPA